ncbi:MAG: glutamine--fructose-6-phosphate transaminase (isomerizing) [Pseudomonadota bacterium]|nr:glutamine--fructose-6-phosphate transaminase (isomerizing) [Pseudomonadota bacterium]MDE3037471.1 glutamine--fructose-6-phosphate transaminase (isomerizing) [Pseudomonadota bacterium]
MCGIIGITGSKDAAPLILGGLKRLEYRGYDSAGIATIDGGKIQRVRAEGKLINLEKAITSNPIKGLTAIGHTRWATHGSPSETNAHPHATEKVAVVHNGIIENFRALRLELEGLGYSFCSRTDTEVVPMLVTHYLKEGLSPQDAVVMTLSRLHGAFALAFIFADIPGLVIGARNGPPLAVGYGKGEMFLGSDAIALAHLTSRIAYLEDGDWAELTPGGVTIRDAAGQVVARPIIESAYSGSMVAKDSYQHFMEKEIHEQPGVVGETLKMYINAVDLSINMSELPIFLRDVERVQLIACGTAYYAGLVGKYWLETVAKVPADADIASEYRYRAPLLDKKGLAVVISQSGETADTLAALRYARQAQPTLAVVNVPGSTMTREASAVLYTYAGPEIGVASTKAFTTQLATLACFSVAMGVARGVIDGTQRQELCKSLLEVPGLMSEILKLDRAMQALAHNLMHARDMLYIGRGTSFALAMEGALKMKEISYIHAEAYAAGELKHGPIALIDEDVPIIVLAPSDALFDKTASNLQEAAARGGKIILISDQKGIDAIGDVPNAVIKMPEAHPFITPLLYALPVQMLAYHTAVLKGTDVDQPRNLAKSVTVE